MPESRDSVSVEPPATNGDGRAAASGTDRNRTRYVRRRLVIAGAMLFVAAWTVAIVYSVMAGGRSPERLTNADARTVAHSCQDARRTLVGIPQLPSHPTPSQVAARVEHEDAALSAMVSRLRGLHPKQDTPATALSRWLDDWTALIRARQNFAKALRTDPNARFVEPATSGINPIAIKMNNWLLEQGTRDDACNTDALQAEVVIGKRTYA